MLSAQVRRVAVLPLSGPNGSADLQAVLLSEMSKRNVFEIVPVFPSDLVALSGKAAWNADEALPEGFIEKVCVATGSDAVMFCQVTHYQPYPPLAVGWRLRLVERHGASTAWAADQVFDTRDQAVAQLAWRHDGGNPDPWWPEPTGLALSPRRFGQCTAGVLLETLPRR
jgi:hypothetical protein